MKTKVYEFRQPVLGLSRIESITEDSLYEGRKELLEDEGESPSYDKVVITDKKDMTSFEKWILEEYLKNELEYVPKLTGDLF